MPKREELIRTGDAKSMFDIAGADYVALCISHMDNDGADGLKCVEEMVAAFQYSGNQQIDDLIP